MKMQEHISVFQLLVLVISFEIGSAIVVGVAGESKQDTWISLLVSTALGIGVVYFYYKLLAFLPGKNFYEIIEYSLGRSSSTVLGIIYAAYFFHQTARITRDFGELMVTAILPNTPVEVINILLLGLIAYILYLGLETLARTTEIFFPYIVGFIGLLSILLMASGRLEITRLQPVLANGLKPLGEDIFPVIMNFPFGEMIAFTCIFCYVSKFRYAGKSGMLGIGIAGVILSFSAALKVMALGVNTMNRTVFPLLVTAREVSVAQFIERIDALVVFIMMLGIVVKCSVYMFAGLKGLEFVFKIPYPCFVFPIAMVAYFFSTILFTNTAEFDKEGAEILPYFLHTPLQYALPVIIFTCTYLRYRIETNRKKEEA